MEDNSNTAEINMASTTLESAFCGSLRSKKYFMTAALPTLSEGSYGPG